MQRQEHAFLRYAGLTIEFLGWAVCAVSVIVVLATLFRLWTDSSSFGREMGAAAVSYPVVLAGGYGIVAGFFMAVHGRLIGAVVSIAKNTSQTNALLRARLPESGFRGEMTTASPAPDSAPPAVVCGKCRASYPATSSGTYCERCGALLGSARA